MNEGVFLANYRTKEESKEFKSKVLFEATKLFIENGYSHTSTREIAENAGVNISSMKQFFGAKENILAGSILYVLKRQFISVRQLMSEATEDPVLFYAAETAVQLYITESCEKIRDLYIAAYSHMNTAKLVRDTITDKLEMLFKDFLPNLEKKDFFEREIASGGMMHGFMRVPCGRYFTIKHKVEAFLECALKVYDVPTEKIAEAIEFVSQFDLCAIARESIDSLLNNLDKSEF